MAFYRKVPQYNGCGCIMSKGGCESDPEEGIQFLPRRWRNLAAPKEERRNTTPGGDEEGGLGSSDH